MVPEKDLKPEVLSKIFQFDKELLKIEQEEMNEISEVADAFFRKRLPVLGRLNEIAGDVESFWAITMQHHHFFESLFDDQDWDILYEYLMQVHIEAIEEHRKAYRLIFQFAENPYFENETLVKELIYADDVDGSDDRIKTVCYPIRWKSDHSLVDQLKSDKFFAWFTDENSEWGETFLEDLYPNALNYYRGAYDPSDEEADDDEDVDDDDDNDDNDDHDDNDDNGVIKHKNNGDNDAVEEEEDYEVSDINDDDDEVVDSENDAH